MKLSEWAKKHDYTYRGAYNVYKAGKIPNAQQLPTGTIIIDEPKTETKPKLSVKKKPFNPKEKKTTPKIQVVEKVQYKNGKNKKS